MTFILGNHDVIVHGFNFARNQKSIVIAYLLGENVKVLEQEKMCIRDRLFIEALKASVASIKSLSLF